MTVFGSKWPNVCHYPPLVKFDTGRPPFFGMNVVDSRRNVVDSRRDLVDSRRNVVDFYRRDLVGIS